MSKTPRDGFFNTAATVYAAPHSGSLAILAAVIDHYAAESNFNHPDKPRDLPEIAHGREPASRSSPEQPLGEIIAKLVFLEHHFRRLDDHLDPVSLLEAKFFCATPGDHAL